MKILVASDKFKGSLTASEACEAIAEGLRESCGGAHSIRCLPVADGGDGIAETLLSALGGTWHETKVTGPLGNSVRAGYAMIDDDRTAVIEMAKASGLVLVGDESKDPWRATTRGTGELILHAIESGAREILLGIGGSATNDGGTGMAEALGYRFEDADGRALAGLPLGLDGLARIVPPGNADFPKVTVACDVSNPLLGRNGCTRIYGPQKGIAPGGFEAHEERLERLVSVLGERAAEAALRPGSGAAGGLGFGARVFLDAVLVPGFELVAGRIGLDAAIAEADFVITGEGRLDAQSLAGKAPHGVARLAREHGKPVATFCGYLEDPEMESDFGTIVEIRDADLDLPANLSRAWVHLRAAAHRFAAASLGC